MMSGTKINNAAEQAANAITLSKLKAIAERLQSGKREPTTAEARFAATFIDHVRVETVIGWLEQLMMTFESDSDAAKLAKFIANLKGG